MKSTVVVAACLCVLLLATSGAHSQTLPGEREIHVRGIPGVVNDGEQWHIAWADFVTADGIIGTLDGGVMFAQEQTDSVRKLDLNGDELIVLRAYGVGALSADAQGRLYAVERTCTEPLNPELAGCQELPRVVQLLPERRVLAMSFADGRSLGRPNDLVADGRGGAYFTAGGLYHVTARGVVTTVAEGDIRTNGVMLSADDNVLYVTNVTEVVAFDVARDGSTSNRRVFGTLVDDSGADGMTIDSEGRLYVTGNAGVHVLSPEGMHLGIMPTPRRPITVAFSGPDKRTLYVPSMGAVGPDGKPWETREGIRNTAMTIYTIRMVSRGFPGRAK